MERSFSIEGSKPLPQPRPRFTVIGGRPRAYQPKNAPISRWKDEIRAQLPEVEEKFIGPVRGQLTFLLPRPKSHRRASGDLKSDAPPAPVGRNTGDLDNLVKPVLDVMTEAGWWDDDAQVVSLRVTKKYTALDQEPGVEAQFWDYGES
jgi:Holliday junction resolvase RusA-like endonuclease